MPEKMDGLISFYASHHALRADKVLGKAGFAVALIPGPRELSPNCGVALRFAYGRRSEATALLAQSRVQIDEVHPYTPRLSEPPGPAPVAAPTAPTENSSPASRFARLWGKV